MKTFVDFLSKFPDKWLLFVVWLIVFLAWFATGNESIVQLLRDLTMALLGILGVRRATTPEGATTNIENVENVEQVSPEPTPTVTINGQPIEEVKE